MKYFFPFPGRKDCLENLLLNLIVKEYVEKNSTLSVLNRYNISVVSLSEKALQSLLPVWCQ